MLLDSEIRIEKDAKLTENDSFFRLPPKVPIQVP